MGKSLIIDFIQNNQKDWQNKLSNPPYSLKIKPDSLESGLYLFQYDFINSDMSIPLVQEARGIIIDLSLMRVVRKSFNKFFNYGESLAHEIDWGSAVVLEKVDGSMISLWYSVAESKWRVSTSGTIDAFKAPVNDFMNFGNLFMDALVSSDTSKMPTERFAQLTDALDPDYTYTFELVSPLNQIVIVYPKAQLYFLTRFNNVTMQEDLQSQVSLPSFINYPKKYLIHSIDEAIEVLKSLGEGVEGFVVSDRHGNRIKIKSAWYLEMHHMIQNGQMTVKNIKFCIEEGIIDDLIGNFPQMAEIFKKYLSSYENLLKELRLLIPLISERQNLEQKEFAEWANKTLFPDFCFRYRKMGITGEDYVKNMPVERFERIIGA